MNRKHNTQSYKLRLRKRARKRELAATASRMSYTGIDTWMPRDRTRPNVKSS